MVMHSAMDASTAYIDSTTPKLFFSRISGKSLFRDQQSKTQAVLSGRPSSKLGRGFGSEICARGTASRPQVWASMGLGCRNHARYGLLWGTYIWTL